MKKSKKIILRALPIVLVMVMVATNVFAISVGVPSGGNEIQSVTKMAGNIWSTLAVIFQVCAIAAIVVAGVRYMFASADTKADIKQQTIILVVGAILVFAAVPFAQFIADIAEDTLTAS